MKSQKNVKSSCYNTHQGQTQDVKQQNVPLSGPNDTTRHVEQKQSERTLTRPLKPPRLLAPVELLWDDSRNANDKLKRDGDP